MKEIFNIEDTLVNKISYYHILAFLVTLPFDRFYSELVLISLLLHTLINFRKQNLSFIKGPILLPLLLYVLTLLATIYSANKEQAFNEWYNHEHIPDVFKFKGVVSARRYKAIVPEDKFQYIAVYEFESEATLRRFLESNHLDRLKNEYDTHFGGVSDRQRAAYLQVWP